tara:strand:+ start:1420 stop:2127 length:708 start_codon:yes stop_codon:yes gene_type:complete
MKKNKKTLSITALIIGFFAATMSPVVGQGSFNLFPSQPTNLVGEVGFVEERIDGGLFTHTDALFTKVGATIGTVGDKELIASFEYVNARGDDFFGGFLGLAGENYYVGTRLGTNSADGDLSGDTDFELNFGYVHEPLFFGIVVGIDAAIVAGGAYDISIHAEREVISAFGVDVTAFAEVGKTWEYSNDYEYSLGALRGSYDLYGGTLYGQLTAVDNEVQTDGFENVLQFGYTRSF